MKNVKYCTALLSLCALSTTHAVVNLEVTITSNAASDGVYFTPVWTAFHDGSFDIFDPGVAASAGLEALAEDGNNGVIDSAFGTASGRLSQTVNNPSGPGPGLFGPGSSNSVQIMVDETDNRYFSYASMILPSNDAFFANGNPTAIELFDALGNFNGEQTITIFGANVWDAGTEVNDTFGAPFSMIGGTSTDEGGTVALHAGLDNFVGTALGNGNILGVALDNGLAPIATITVNVVPEPSTYAAIFGSLVLGTVMVLRRRKAGK
ncbi:MAG: spondin domain-containing protein [Verrucomicrobiota bacterium]